MISSPTYDEWIEAFDGKVKKLVLIGQTAEKIEVLCAQTWIYGHRAQRDL